MQRKIITVIVIFVVLTIIAYFIYDSKQKALEPAEPDYFFDDAGRKTPKNIRLVYTLPIYIGVYLPKRTKQGIEQGTVAGWVADLKNKGYSDEQVYNEILQFRQAEDLTNNVYFKLGEDELLKQARFLGIIPA